jgi:hypothetical protein
MSDPVVNEAPKPATIDKECVLYRQVRLVFSIYKHWMKFVVSILISSGAMSFLFEQAHSKERLLSIQPDDSLMQYKDESEIDVVSAISFSLDFLCANS